MARLHLCKQRLHKCNKQKTHKTHKNEKLISQNNRKKMQTYINHYCKK